MGGEVEMMGVEEEGEEMTVVGAEEMGMITVEVVGEEILTGVEGEATFKSGEEVQETCTEEGEVQVTFKEEEEGNLLMSLTGVSKRLRFLNHQHQLGMLMLITTCILHGQLRKELAPPLPSLRGRKLSLVMTVALSIFITLLISPL